jgi:hypothetical protein
MRVANFIVTAALMLGGCAAGVAYEPAPVSPDLVYVSPGVQVIADYRAHLLFG